MPEHIEWPGIGRSVRRFQRITSAAALRRGMGNGRDTLSPCPVPRVVGVEVAGDCHRGRRFRCGGGCGRFRRVGDFVVAGDGDVFAEVSRSYFRPTERAQERGSCED